MRYTKAVIEMRKSKKGFTLIEIIISICIIDILMATMFSVYIVIIKDYEKQSKETKNDFYAWEAFRFIENEIKSGNFEVNVSNNIIKIKEYNAKSSSQVLVNNIELKGNNVVISYEENGFYQGTNNILRNIDTFHVEMENNLILINLKFSKGKVYDKCIDLQ